MIRKFKVLPASTLFLGIVCFIWTIYDIVKIYSDLGSVIFFDTSGLIVGIGYLLILLFHILIFIIYFKYFRHHQNNVLSVSLLSLLIISFFALIIEKIMFDEVLHEYYLEFPHLLIVGKFVNGRFSLLTRPVGGNFFDKALPYGASIGFIEILLVLPQDR